jgi:ribosome-associated toxin RatA of RatAB toxin-antitoxin module
MTRRVEVEEIFAVGQEEAFDAYWRLSNWPQALDTILDVKVEYDDGTHQCFEMTVQCPGRVENVRGARFNDRGRRLELCQFVPPPGFRSMTGAWNFEPIARDRTRVRAERSFAVEDPNREGAVASMLNGLLAKNLLAFKTLVETRRS